jgi:hypothetical protein
MVNKNNIGYLTSLNCDVKLAEQIEEEAISVLLLEKGLFNFVLDKIEGGFRFKFLERLPWEYKITEIRALKKEKNQKITPLQNILNPFWKEIGATSVRWYFTYQKSEVFFIDTDVRKLNLPQFFRNSDIIPLHIDRSYLEYLSDDDINEVIEETFCLNPRDKVLFLLGEKLKEFGFKRICLTEDQKTVFGVVSGFPWEIDFLTNKVDILKSLRRFGFSKQLIAENICYVEEEE